jgi:hypothetical protein
MSQNIKEFYGNKLAARDGDIGKVKDFYFDDKTWVIRYLVADTGSWLPGRLVLLSPYAFGKLDLPEKTLHVRLSKKQIEDSPPLEAHMPVSRQFETKYHSYFEWPPYWQGPQMWGMGNYPIVMPASAPVAEHSRRAHADPHLRSTQALVGYHIETVDGTIGHVSGFLVDDRSWAIDDLVVEAGHWYSGKEILISPSKIERISYGESKVHVKLTKAEIQRTCENEPAKAGIAAHATGNLRC